MNHTPLMKEAIWTTFDYYCLIDPDDDKDLPQLLIKKKLLYLCWQRATCTLATGIGVYLLCDAAASFFLLFVQE